MERQFHWDLHAPRTEPPRPKGRQPRDTRRVVTEAFPEFYGDAAQITVDQSQRHTIADITTPSGAQVSVVRKRIRLKKPGHDAMVADTLLAHSLWGQATADGHVRFEMEAVAYGKALGVNINARRGSFL